MKKYLVALLTILIFLANAGMTMADTEPNPQQKQLSNFQKTSMYNNDLKDIAGHWAEGYIAAAYEYGIISGIGGGLYEPEGRLTVAQAVTIAARLHMVYKYSDDGAAMMEEYTISSPAQSGHWAEPYLSYALGEGLLTEPPADPELPITRGEAAGIMARILDEKDLEALNIVNNLPDVSTDTPNFVEITLLYEAGIVRGSNKNGVFNPEQGLSRAEAATIFMMMVEAERRTSGKIYGEQNVRLLAGTGTSGFADENLAAASFTLPQGITVDRNGKVLVFDTYNNALRSVDNGKIKTIAGQWVAKETHRFSRGFYRDGSLDTALFNRPTDGVYNSSGDLYVCDSENHVIRLIKDNQVFTFAGTAQGYKNGKGSDAMFDTPQAIDIDRNGNLYVADTMNNCIRRIDTKGNVTTVAGVAGEIGYGDGRADSALFYNPSGIAVSDDGRVIYVADTGNHLIRKIENNMVSTLSGQIAERDEDGDPMGAYVDGGAKKARFNLPKGLALAEDMLFIADSGNNVIRSINMSGQAFTAAGTGEPGDREGGPLSAEFNQPTDVYWHQGVLYIADTSNNMIKTLSLDNDWFKEAK